MRLVLSGCTSTITHRNTAISASAKTAWRREGQEEGAGGGAGGGAGEGKGRGRGRDKGETKEREEWGGNEKGYRGGVQ